MNNESSVPNAGSYLINFVYGDLAENDVKVNHRGDVSVIWSTNPIEGCDAHVYHNAFSYQGKIGGMDILLMLEPVVVLPGEYAQRVWKHFDHIIGLFDALAAQYDKFHKISFPRADIAGKSPVTEIQSQRESLYPLSDRKNAICMISGNKRSHVPSELYSKRIELAQWFSQNSNIPFDVYGKPPYALPNYRGAIPDGEKLSVMKQYRYSLCFENTNHPVLSAGNITEKILDCLETRTIPIYLGASNIEQYIPPECFIDFRKFAQCCELDAYLHSMSDHPYKQTIAHIDTFVCGGGLRKYSESALYDDVAKVLIDAKSLDARYFNDEICWRPGPSSSIRQMKWKVSKTPAMWTWKQLSKAEPPNVINGKIIDEQPEATEPLPGNAPTRPAKSFLHGKMPSLKVLIAGAKFHSGNARRGYDYGWWNLCDALHRFENIRMQFFDYATEAQQRGIAGMSERLAQIVREDKPDVFFYNPCDLPVHILAESLKSLTDSTDTQTILWMTDSDWRFASDAGLWAPCVDYIITTSHEMANTYQESGFGHKIIQSQWAFNPFTYPMKKLPKTRDISFVGSARGNRPDIIDKLRQSGLPVDAFGNGWHEDSYIPFYDMVRVFSQSRVNLNLRDTPSSRMQPVKRRLFEVAGCGGFIITTTVHNLEEYYEPDKEVVVASSPAELIDKAKYFLSHEREREDIARRGYERTIAQHTWTQRLSAIFRQIGFSAIPKESQRIPSRSYPPADPPVLPTDKNNDEDIPATLAVGAYNQLHFTKQCVESILHYTDGPYELMLTDNGSTDGTINYFEWIKSFHPHTRIIRYFENRIVEANGNYGVSIARGRYIVGVTNDTVVHEGWLTNLINQIESAPDIVMVGPRSNNISGPQAAPADYDTLETYHSFAAEWSRSHRGENFPIHRMVGMFTIAKKAVLERIGGHDPDLPTNGRDGGYGFSDDDIALRYTLAGYRMLVANDVYIHHYGSVTASKYRPDLFGPAQNINKEKYLRKLQKNDRITIGAGGEMLLTPYNSDDEIPVDERTAIRAPRIGFVETEDASSKSPGADSRYAGVAKVYGGQLFKYNHNINSLILETLAADQYDLLVLIDPRLAPAPEKISALTDTALCYPDVVILVPVGNYAPSTHTPQTSQGVEIIPYADLSLCVLNLKQIRSFAQGFSRVQNDAELLWFIQRRVRGEGYFIAKANDIVVDSDSPQTLHPYEDRALPEQLIKEKKYAEAVAIYNDDLVLDPTFAESHYQLACIAKEQQQTEAAVTHAEQALQADAHHIPSLVLLSRTYLERGDVQSARSVIQQANLKQPGNPEVQKIVELYEAQMRGEPGIFLAEYVSKTPPLTHSECIKEMTSIIIPVKSLHLHECVSSIKKHTTEPHEIIYLDYGNTPQLKKMLKKILAGRSNDKRLKCDGNANFVQSLNEGINQSDGEYIVLLFDDVLVYEGWLSDMRGCLLGSENSGVVGAMSDEASGMQRVEGVDHRSPQERMSFRERNRHRRIYSRYLDGFCMLFRRSLLSRINLFDEAFGTDQHVFDDFCCRAVLEGFANVIAGNVYVHTKGAWNTLLSRDKTYFDKKWRSLEASGSLAEKALTVNSMEKARSSFNQGAIGDAVKTLIGRIGFSPSEKKLYYLLTKILIEEKKYQDVLGALKGLADIEEDAEYYETLGYANEGMTLYPEAEEYADKALAVNGTSAPALNLKGILAYRNNATGKAAELFRQALKADPGYGEPYTNLGMLSWASEQREEALNLFEKGFVLSPDRGDVMTAYYHAIDTLGLYGRAANIFSEARAAYPENKRILFLLIDILLKLDKSQEAMKQVERAITYFGTDEDVLAAASEIRKKIDPIIFQPVETQTDEPSRRAQQYFEEGNALIKKGEIERSVKAFQAAIIQSPHNAAGCYLNMGYALKQQGKIDEAIRCYEKAISLQPGYADAYCNLGNAYKEKDELTQAIGCYRKALALNPADKDSLYNLGNIFREQGKFDEAIESYQKALKIKKDHVDAHSNLCVVLKEKGDLKEAEKCCRKLIKIAPDFPEAHWNLALIQLLAGKLKEGWEGYEWRWKKPDFAAAHREFPRPLWTGYPIDGKTILIHAEQGYGDVIQFIRYVPMLAERGARVIVECQPELKSLMATVEGVSEAFARGETLPDFDVHCPILSLPGAFATTLDTLPATIPYIAADLSVFNKWREIIRDDRNANLKVGIAWAGSPAHKNDKNRSCPFDQLLPLFSLKHIAFYSLQKNDRRHSPAANTNIDSLIDYTGEIHDFLDTAGFMQNLDVVISVDTAAAHLAGALGKEVWTLLPFAPEWRWMQERKDSPWYPTMRLFRQDRFGNWQGVIERVKDELQTRSASTAPKEPGAAKRNPGIESRSKNPNVPGLTSIIIHGLNNLKNIKDCLEKLKDHTPEPFEVIFADNNCPPETRKWLKKQVKTATHYRHEASTNPGLAPAINRGIRASSGEYIALLSSDVMVSRHWLPDLLACLNRAPAVGIVGPMMNADQGKQTVGYPDYKGLEQLSAFSGLFRKTYRHRRISARTVSGYCLMFKRDLYDNVGDFDNNPFFGKYAFEDYCFRAQLEGYLNCLCGDVYVHVSSGADRLDHGSRKAFQDKWSLVDKEKPLAETIYSQTQLEAADRLVLQGKTDLAINTLIQGIGQLPCAKDLYYSLAEVLLEDKRYQDAIGALKAMPSDRTDARQFEIMGTCEEGLGLDKEAEQSADQALSLTKSARAYNLKGVLSFKNGSLEHAEAFFKRAMDCDPGYGEPYTNTGVLRWSMGQKHDGLAWMEKGFILSPQISDGSDRYYSALMDLGQYERGETILREAKNAYPGKRIIFLLIDSLLKQNKYKEAMAEAEDAIISFGLEEGMLEAALEIRSKIGPKTVDKSNGRPSLSLCMIVKNEEPSLANCLSSVKHIVDEMIVADTGSSDLTKEIALAYGAKLYDYEWTHSFADARNYSLDQAQGDWVLLLDGDEVISLLDHEAIRNIVSVNDQKKAFAITTRNYLDQVTIEGWTPNDDRYYREAAGCGWMPSEKVRIFPNRKSIRFENPVHEFVESSLANAGIQVHRSAIPIHHYGKLDREKMHAKKETYYQLGIKKLDEKGNDLKSLVEIAVQAGEAGRHEDALMWWQKVIEINPNESVAYYNMGSVYLLLKRYAKGIEASRKSLEIYPHRKEAVTNLALGEMIGGDIRTAIRILEGLINEKVVYPVATGLLAIAYCMDGRTNSGLKHLASLKKMNYRLTPLLLDTSQRLVDAGRNADATRLLKALIEGGHADYELVNYHAECVKRCM